LLAQAHDEAQDTEFLAGNGAGAVDLQDFPGKFRQANMTISLRTRTVRKKSRY
jgi:hypothetical protein